MKPIRGIVPKKQIPLTPTLTGSLESILKTVEDLKQLQKDTIFTLDSKVEETDELLSIFKEDSKSSLENVDKVINEKSQLFDGAIQHLVKTTNEAQNIIENTKNEALRLISESKGDTGDAGQDADESRIIDAVVKQIPVVDEKKLFNKILKALPDKKGDLKIIQEKVEIDPMSVIDKILKLAKDGKFELPSKNISGLEQTMRAFQNQIGTRGYLHGGGDTVVAGANITIVPLPNGTKQINSSIPPTVLTLQTNSVQNGSQTLLNLIAGTGISITDDGHGGITFTPTTGTGTVTSVAASGGTTGLTFSGSPITTAGTLTLGGILTPTNGGTGVANNIASTITISGAFALTATLTNTTSVTFPTSGTLATTTQLPVGANPTASVGLTAVNGSAVTFLRSDGAPALSQAIAPTWTGIHTFTPTARSSGSASYFTINAPADTGITTATESRGINILGATRTWADGTVASQAEYYFGAPTYNKTTTSATFTQSGTLVVGGPPIAGTGVTLTNAYSLWVKSGNVHVGDQIGGSTLQGEGAKGMELDYSDNGNGGVALFTTNTNNGANAFTGINMSNDLANDNTFTHFAGMFYTSSGYSYTGFGTAFALPNQLQVYGTDGPTLIGTNAIGSYVNFVIGGIATANEVARFTTAGLTIGLAGTLTGAIKFAGATSGSTTLQSLATASGTLTMPSVTDTLAVLGTAQSFTKAQRGTFVTLTDASTIAVDASLGNNYFIVLGGARILGVPTNPVAGQTGVISVMQDITGGRTLAYTWPWQFAGGTAPTLSTGKLVLDQLYYSVNKYATSTVTVTIAAPGVMTWTAHGLSSGDRIQLTTSGALPTGLSVNTTYWITVIGANTFNLSTSLANAQAATFITTTGSQSGTHTATNFSITVANALAIA